MGCAAAFAISIAQERQRGMLRRLRACPIGVRELLLGKALACWFTCSIAAGLMLAIATLGFGVRLARPLELTAAVASLGLCFTGLMALISTTGASERAVAGAGWASLLFLAMLGGVMAPRMIMPEWLKAAGAFSPVTWAVAALERALWRGGPALEGLGEWLWLCAVGLAGLGAGAFVLARSRV